ncbi:hypothetical protein MANES_09G056100v8 [Manihot esculenta]|uniref:Uncharacterized protein n=1 Tax=Manihot esculenta TaxID=3983 RepID=A0ACB7H4D9_MANES|nr:hypothetical protein MANES_09G056100v8 [Manihot esculenta]
MVVTESEDISQGEVESPLQSDHHFRSNLLSSLGRQSSIYSLTLDEFQHALCEGGKNFGSMNMDEFIASIWNAEEHQAVNGATSNNDQINNKGEQGFNNLSGVRVISKQPSLSRQGSLSLPAPLCRKTVDEVWSEMHREQEQEQQYQGQSRSNGNNIVNNPESAAPRQPTFGEMTLEDFLVKAGVVREQYPAAPSGPPQQQQYGMYQSSNNNNKTATGTGFVSRTVLGIGGGTGGGAVSYQTMPQGAGPIGETSGRNGGFPQQTAAAAGSAYGGRVGNGGGYAPSQAMGVMGQVSPVSSDTIRSSSIDNAANQFGIDVGGLRGRKRMVDGPVEKVVERRQRRMIKNRESAARSRARKQAYTVELEAELNQLKEENKQLRHALYMEELRMKAQSKAQNSKEKLRRMRRNFSCPL